MLKRQGAPAKTKALLMAHFSLLPIANLSDLGPGFPDRMALVDIETTGGKATRDGITEIAVIIFEHGRPLGYWQTMVNPQAPIPSFITGLTGISNAMVKGAPLFSEIAETLLELLSGRVFVAHNARFDYGFIKQAFKRSGIDYSTQPLCSVKFSRALFTAYKNHGMDALSRRFNLQLPSRHRALGDCIGIAQFFSATKALVSEEDIIAACKSVTETAVLPSHLPKSRVNKVPNKPGVYYFYDGDGELLYIGKSVNLKKRVMSHFYQDHQNAKDLDMSRLIADVTYTVTNSDFGAQLLESQEIKRFSPPFNRRLKKLSKLYKLNVAADDKGFHHTSISSAESSDIDLLGDCGLFRSRKQARTTLLKMADDFFLCHRLLGLEPNSGRACFRAQLNRCFGACSGAEEKEDYNARLAIALEQYRVRTWPYKSAVIIKEPPQSSEDELEVRYYLVDQWRILAHIQTQAELEEFGYAAVGGQSPFDSFQSLDNYPSGDSTQTFDLDAYKILVSFLLNENQQRRCALELIHCIPLDAV